MRGELKLVASRVGEDALAEGVAVSARFANGSSRALRVRSLRRHQGRPLVAFDGIDDAAAAGALSGAELWVDRAGVVLADDEYFADDLAGCALVAADGTVLGTVAKVEQYPAQDVLVVERPQGRRAMVPLVRAFVKNIDVRAKRIAVDVPPGLLDLSEAEEV